MIGQINKFWNKNRNFSFKKITLLSFAFSLWACEPFYSAQTKHSLAFDQNVQEDMFFRLMAEESLSGVFSKEVYRVSAYLPGEISHLELFSHFTSFELEDGIRLRFERKDSQLSIRIFVQAWPEKLLFEKEDYFSSNQNEIDFSIEVVNGTDYGFQVRIWENFLNRHPLVKEKTNILRLENLIADSHSQKMIFYTKGQGMRWGIKLFRAYLIEGARVSPRIL